MKVIREKRYLYHAVQVVELGGDYFVVRVEGEQCFSAMRSDHPAGGGVWAADYDDDGVAIVASPRTRDSALSGFRRVCVIDDANAL